MSSAFKVLIRPGNDKASLRGYPFKAFSKWMDDVSHNP